MDYFSELVQVGTWKLANGYAPVGGKQAFEFIAN